MKKVTNRSYQATQDELQMVGAIVERLQQRLQELTYGVYSADNISLEELAAIRVLTGMGRWQRDNNIGIRLRGDVHISIELYDLIKEEDELNKAIVEIDW